MRVADDADPVQVRFDTRIARLAAAQHGVFSRTQALRLGATRGMLDHRLRLRRWERLGRHVLRMAGTPSSWRQSLMAATLAWGDGAVVSHWAAAALWRLVAFEPGPLEVTIPRECKRRGPGTAHRCRLSPSDVTRVDGISVTIPSRTLIDLAATVDVDRLEEAMDDALRRRIVTASQMRRRLETIGRRGRPGTAAMRRVLAARDDAAPVPESVFERRLLRVFDRAGLPSPVLHTRSATAIGRSGSWTSRSPMRAWRWRPTDTDGTPGVSDGIETERAGIGSRFSDGASSTSRGPISFAAPRKSLMPSVKRWDLARAFLCPKRVGYAAIPGHAHATRSRDPARGQTTCQRAATPYWEAPRSPFR